MTISSENRKAGPYLGNGVVVTFPFSFRVFARDQVMVIYTNADGVESTLTLDSNYDLKLNDDQSSNPGGYITYPHPTAIIPVPAPLPAGCRITLLSAIPYDQETDITNGGGFYPNVIEDSLDKMTMLTQQLKESMGRAVLVPVSGDITPDDYLDVFNNIQTIAPDKNYIEIVGNDLGGSGWAYDLGNVTDPTTGNVSTHASYTRTVADNIAVVQNVSTHMSDVTGAVASAAAAATSATASANSATAAAGYATNASNSATAASSSSTSAHTAQTSAESARDLAQGYATSASTSASTATTQAGIATTQATNASTSASTATTQAGIATTKATDAASSATTATTAANNTAALLASFRSVFLGAFASDSAAATFAASQSITLTAGIMYENTTVNKFRIYSGSAWGDYDASAQASQSAAALSAASAAASASDASSSATSASTSATTATTQAGVATTQAGNAATSATNAANSATSAGTSATNAASSATSAAASATNAANSYTTFHNTYQGAYATAPTARPDSTALQSGDLYFNTASGVMNVYDGSVWKAAYVSLAGALIAANNLSDVASTATARSNLGVPATTGSGASGTWGISVSGNAATVTNGVYTSGSYANPAWITSLAYSKITSAPTALSSFTNDSGYVTQSGARTSISVSGSLSYNSTTGVISYTQPTNVSAFTNDAGYLTSIAAGSVGVTQLASTLDLGSVP